MEKRNFKDPKYKEWRRRVYSRDGWKCQMPYCPRTSKKLEAHHIKRWANFPSLRYVVTNGITLCKFCHDRIGGCEEEFEGLFMSLVTPGNKDLTLTMIMMRYGKT